VQPSEDTLITATNDLLCLGESKLFTVILPLNQIRQQIVDGQLARVITDCNNIQFWHKVDPQSDREGFEVNKIAGLLINDLF